MHFALFAWNWPSGFGEEDFKILSVHFRLFVIIYPWKKQGPSCILITQECFVPSLSEIGPVALQKKIFVISSMY